MSYTMLPAGQRRGRVRALLAIGATSAVVAGLALPGAVSAKPLRAENSAIYLVQLAGDPLATYAGGVSNIPATRPAVGQKLDTRSWNYNAYRQYLQKQRSETLSRAGIDEGKKVADYGVTFNGFAAALTPEDLRKLDALPSVARIFKNRIHTVQTNNTPRFLGLSGPNGVWNQFGGGQARAGEGQIVGVIDSGFWPESPSFRALSEPRPDADTIAAKWNGTCDAGDTQPVECNNKVIGARWYDFAGNQRQRTGEYHSPRDRNGHGSHTASTAAGNPADASVAGSAVGQVSGVAPAARLSIYKALWYVQATGSATGTEVDIVAAIDDAVADGVDVINYSVGDTVDDVGAVEVAFLQAAAAGVFVSASAGNSGPGAATVNNTMPWETTVAASTHDVMYARNAVLGNGTTFEGVGIGAAGPTAPLINSSAAGLPGANENSVRQCHSNPPSLDPAKVAGKIVVCERGVTGANARVDKSLAVRNAGGVGMILVNVVDATQSLNVEVHAVPTVHLGVERAEAVKAYAATPGATASLPAHTTKPQRAPAVIGFSSRGPSQASGGDLLKPDISAPGVDVVAAVPPVANALGSFYDVKGGTSMAAPHIAGIAALIRAQHPTWSPLAVKSAMMTTAYQTDNQGRPIGQVGLAAAASPLDMGAGHVRPGSAFDPGLVYDSGPLEWLQWACGVGANLPPLGDGSSVCDAVGTMDPSNLNYPSIAIGALAGSQTVTRTVTNTTNQASVYVAKVEAPPGVTVKVTPSVLTVLPRRSATYTVEFTRTSAAFNKYASGAVTLADLRGHSVRSPFTVQPVAMSAPTEVVGTGTSGSQQVKVQPGYNGSVTATAFGLVAPDVRTSRLVGADQEFDPNNPATNPAVAKHTVTVPAGAKYAKVNTYGSDYPTGTDIDLYVYQGSALVGVGGSSGSNEEVQLPGAGSYDVYVVQYATAPGVTEQDVKLYAHVVGNSNAGNFSVTPSRHTAVVGREVTFTVNWSGLTPGTRYFGFLEFGDGSAAPVRSALVTITT
ncbi:hypothetical protein GCM10009557_05380 [Virgisporangium ochraceum]|uniref:Peptidase inhibitor I9 n=1 Tax=Virgisporangium ochraceum TaxID=65505 RepID=A0A8J3ZKQ1_9ACTN|nr:S8 family serine peptidase [Virgisporangium ochraceum]GIJ65867.1 hypothetical protein Voc01_007840 [Virgisporangium ochraceum]